MKKIVQFLFSRSGATAVEYAMVAFLISVAIITGAASVGAAVNAKFLTTAAAVTSAGG